jgi:hypothetical protein
LANKPGQAKAKASKAANVYNLSRKGTTPAMTIGDQHSANLSSCKMAVLVTQQMDTSQSLLLLLGWSAILLAAEWQWLLNAGQVGTDWGSSQAIPG